MFCRNCGAQLPDHSAFCPRCGSAVNGQDKGAGYAPMVQIREKRIAIGVAVAVAAIVVIAAVVLGIRPVTGKSGAEGLDDYDTLVSEYIDAVFEKDGEKALGLMSQEVYTELYENGSDGESRKEIADQLEDCFESSVSPLVSGLSDDWYYTYDILSDWDLDLSSLGDNGESESDSLEIEEGKRETIYIQIKEEDGTTVAGGKMVLPVLKLNGKWSLGSFFTMFDSGDEEQHIFNEVPVSAGDPSVNSSPETAVDAYIQAFFRGDEETLTKSIMWEAQIAYNTEQSCMDSQRDKMYSLEPYMGQGSTYHYEITDAGSMDANEVRLENERFNDYGLYDTVVEDEYRVTVGLYMQKNGISREFDWDFTVTKINGAWYVLREGIPEERNS